MPTHAETLEVLIAVGTGLAHDILAAHRAGEITPTQAAEAFGRVSRATRRTVLLAARPAEAPAPAPLDTARPSAANLHRPAPPASRNG